MLGGVGGVEALGSPLSRVFIKGVRIMSVQPEEPERSFSFMTKKHGATMKELRDEYEDTHAPMFVAEVQGIIRRYSRNYLVKVLGPDQPDFNSITEFAHIPGGAKIVTSSIKTDPVNFETIARIADWHFTQQLVAGSPLIYESGAVYKRAIFLRRATKASSPKIVTTELSGFVDGLAKQLHESVSRVMLYTGISPRCNYPTVYYPARTELDRYFDAIVMLWPTEGATLPESFMPPSNYRTLFVVDFETHDSEIDLHAKQGSWA